MKEGYSGKKTLVKGGKGLMYAAGGAAGTAAIAAMIAFFGDPQALTAILENAGVGEALTATAVVFMTGLARMASNLYSQRK